MTEQPEVQRSTGGSATHEDPAPPPARRRRWPLVVALLLHAALSTIFLGSGLVLPGYGRLMIWALWYASIAVTVYVWRRRPLLALAMPPTLLVLWFVVLMVGEMYLWTA